ncbi:MAG: electron transfer flavoprotein beta subunit/FixA family protein [Methanobacteriota archaeon]|nr:MAG: electron transfer flavoprotein beta subunit/FixA family protein [Euryarchaeota archaeon]
MKIVVMLKAVPDTETRFQIRDDGKDVVYDDSIEWIASPYDEYALEAAIQTKEKLGGTVTLLTLGKGVESQVIRKALAMGADDAVLVNNEALADSDPLGIAKVLAKELEALQPDLVFAGRLATDTADSFVGPAVGELLNMPVVAEISGLEVEEGKVVVTRDATARKEKFELTLPAIVTTDKGLNEPRYPKLPDIMKAKKKKVDEKDGAEYLEFAGTSNRKVTQVKVEFPPAKKGGVIFKGDLDEAIEQLVDALHNKEKVI